MRDYYRERAAEYDEWFYRQGRYDHGAEANARWFTEAEKVFAALDALSITGDVLELAPGTGIWTERLVRTARSVTAVDASPEMIALNRAKVASSKVAYVQADLFSWQPERTYDAVVFCYWISHVPVERLDGFLGMVARALRPGGKVFFVDGQPEPSGTASDQTLPSAGSQLMTRRLNDGRSFQIVKNHYPPAMIEARCAAAGIDMAVHQTATYFTYGVGTRR
jgi:demethylmenaquinone methyltransferase/2-methoxy-6-polyprenyl-1,4-benzoquinol methylase